MARFVKGDIVVVPFPFSDLSGAKRRPALAVLTGDDLILCQITSRQVADRYAVALEGVDFLQGSLRQSSNIRPNRLFTADQGLILYAAGRLVQGKVDEVIDAVVGILRG